MGYEKQQLTKSLFVFFYSSFLLFFSQLHIASANGYLSVVEFLLDHHVSTDVVDDDLWQPVHAAACWGHVSIYLTCLDQFFIHFSTFEFDQ